MELRITDLAMEKIAPVLNKTPNRRLVLMFDDGVSPYSVTAEGAMQNSLVVLIVEENQPLLPWFDLEIDSNYGKIPVKSYAKDYLGEHMILDVTDFGGMVISSEQGVLDDTVVVRDGTTMGH
ncbi:iron-sulfur cluster biosynthesis family protein [Weissella muntiaci]|uniref:Iron-sulfur cluster biosynthesis family protein n=1 Tax=Weissella muntiaci TaxID=2508881 RepID=A0A6C2C1I6_9LACO|nr:iron-sulfur cluster biosynthesis family protein [Weissella muntiaci]TYC47804.1 iron-sulfur cluster biosynthesis family protein [Weissella muntiaci]